MATFFTSDLHFGHVNILKYGRGDAFGDLDNMRETIIANINSMVGPDDTLYILGDVVMGQRAENLPHVGRLNGTRRLILGNHDYPHPCNPDKVRNRHTATYAPHFDSMAMSQHLFVGDRLTLLTHFPASLDHTDEVRYADYRPVTDLPVLHGHLHCDDIVVEPNHVHVGIDADYTAYGIPRYHPIPLETVAQVLEEL